VTLNSGKLRAIANLLSDPLQAGAAAHVLAREVARPKGQARAMRRSAQKDPRVLLALGARLAAAKRTLSPDAYDAFRRREPVRRRWIVSLMTPRRPSSGAPIMASFVSLWMRRNYVAEGPPICSSDG
jgi:hypothetical protein